MPFPFPFNYPYSLLLYPYILYFLLFLFYSYPPPPTYSFLFFLLLLHIFSQNLILLPILAGFPRIFRLFILATVQKRQERTRTISTTLPLSQAFLPSYWILAFFFIPIAVLFLHTGHLQSSKQTYTLSKKKHTNHRREVSAFYFIF